MIFQTRTYSYYADGAYRNDEKTGLIMLHGFMGCGAVFSHLGDPLSNTSSPLFLDLLGHGETDKPKAPNAYKTENQCRELRQIIENSGFQKPFLYGYSMGGRLALQFAIRNPDAISGLILESCTAGIRNESEREKRASQDEKRASEIERNYEHFLLKWNKMDLFGEKFSADRALTEAFQESQETDCMAACLRGFGTGVMPQVWDKLPDLDIPVQLIAGDRDTKFATIMMEMETLLPQANLRVITGASHRTHLDQPEMLTDVISEFITQY